MAESGMRRGLDGFFTSNIATSYHNIHHEILNMSPTGDYDIYEYFLCWNNMKIDVKGYYGSNRGYSYCKTLLHMKNILVQNEKRKAELQKDQICLNDLLYLEIGAEAIYINHAT